MSDLVKIDVRDSEHGKFGEITEKLEKMKSRALEFAQTRSSFQIEKFVGADQYTPAAKYRHFAHNSHVLLENLKNMLIDRERMLRKLEKLKAELEDNGRNKQDLQKFGIEGDDENFVFDPHYKNLDLDIYQLNCSLDAMEISIKGTMSELAIFERVLDQLEKDHGGPFTYEEFENAQPEEWHKRLSNQMHRSQAGARFGIGEGNYASYLQALEQPILPESNNVIPPIPNEFDHLAITALHSRGNINQLMLREKEEKKELPPADK